MTLIEAKHVGRNAKTIRAGKNSHGTTEIATGQVVEILRVSPPLSHLDGPDRAEVFVQSHMTGVTSMMQARDLVLLTATVRPPVETIPGVSVTWRELKEALRPLEAFADQDEIALGAAADAVLALLAEKAAA